MIEVEKLDKDTSSLRMDKSDVLKIALAIQGIAMSCPPGVLRRVDEYLKEIEMIVGKYAGNSEAKE